jgi:hypothetical protein
MVPRQLHIGTSKNYLLDEAAYRKPAHDHSFSHVHGAGAPVFRGAYMANLRWSRRLAGFFERICRKWVKEELRVNKLRF